MKNYIARDKKLKKRKNSMRVSGRSLLTTIEPLILKKSNLAKSGKKSKSRNY